MTRDGHYLKFPGDVEVEHWLSADFVAGGHGRTRDTTRFGALLGCGVMANSRHFVFGTAVMFVSLIPLVNLTLSCSRT